MKLRLSSRRSEQGNLLLVALCTMMVVGLALLTYLQLAKNQNHLVARSQVWNACLPLAEAGLEDALNHCGWNVSNWVSSGWSLSSSNTLTRSNVFSTSAGWYNAIISTNGMASNQVTITSTGYYPMPGTEDTYIPRTVRVTAGRLPVYRYAIYGASAINFNGNGIVIDSYDPRDNTKSTSGLYSSSKASDKADVGTYAGKGVANYDIGNANIWGHVHMGPGGTVKVGANGKVGSVSYQGSGPKGTIQSGWLRTDLNISIPPVSAPPGGGGPTTSGWVGLKYYTHILASGNYEVSSMSGNVLVTGDSLIYCTGNANIGDLLVQTNASIMLFVGGSSININDTINRTQRAANIQILGLPSVTSLDLDNGFMGAVYCPQATCTFNGSEQIYGAVCAKTITMKGTADLHYDESLADPNSFKNKSRGFIISSWTEL